MKSFKKFELFKVSTNELNTIHGGYESYHGGCAYSGGGIQNTNPNSTRSSQNNPIDFWYYQTMYEIGPIA